MMLTRRTGLLFVLAVFSLSGVAVADGDANAILGQRAVNDGPIDEAGVEGQLAIGVQVSLDLNGPVDLAVDLLTSSDNQTQEFQAADPLRFTTEIDTVELDLGVRKFWGERAQPYVGGGVAWIQMDVKQTLAGSVGPAEPFIDVIVDDSDSKIGYWLNAGFQYRVGEHFNVGADLRYSDAEATFTPRAGGAPIDLDAGGTQIGVLLGYHW